MANEDGSLWLTFNGEVYNFHALRAELAAKGHPFRSDSDTETVLHLYEEEGVGCLQQLRGMFAFALWDARRRTLFLARDRLGKKPLFYYHDGRRFLFGSAPKAILQDPAIRAEADPEAIHHYLTYGFVPGPWSAFRGIKKLPPAHYLLVRDGAVSVHRYWSLRYVPKRTGSAAALGEELLALLEEAVRLRLISDVPLGALLSGGVDSSTIVALMRRLTAGPVRTFSIGFDRPEYDELRYARAVARRFETDHHELVVKPDAVAALPRLIWHCNEPFADSSALPAFHLCEMARGLVTVALSGDGGDEAFAGYDRYRAARLAARLDAIPVSIRRAVSRVAGVLPLGGPRSPVDRWRRFLGALALAPRRRYGRWLVGLDAAAVTTLYSDGFAARVRHLDPLRVLEAAYDVSDAPGFLEQTLHADVQLYLPDDLLVKMDVASMAHSLEVRSPFLDHRVMEFAASLPPDLKLRGSTQKYLIKRVMTGLLPEAVVRRRKMGFGVPIDHWLRSELRELVHEVLLDRRAEQRGYFRPETVRRYLADHARGRANHHARLWSLLVLELWHRMHIDEPCPVEPPGLR
jgi:asparagine synthase (glutamine-hydrolysing)